MLMLLNSKKVGRAKRLLIEVSLDVSFVFGVLYFGVGAVLAAG